MTIADKVRAFVLENFYVADAGQLGDDTSLIVSGIVDSTGMLEIISFLEAEFGVEIGDREAIPANLETIGRIQAFVARKRGDAAAPAA